jgi:hypothetical protein
MERIIKVTVEFPVSNKADKEDIAQYVEDAISAWGGSLHPDDPMFGNRDAYVSKLKYVRKLRKHWQRYFNNAKL